MNVIEPESASKKRLFLSWYIDFILFMTLWTTLSYLMKIEDSIPFWAPFTAFILIRFLFIKYTGSVGYIFLSINKHNLHVNEYIFKRENWLTMFIGLLLTLEGTKQLVRWTQTFVSQPAFGFFPTESTQITFHITLGVVYVLAGYWFLKLDIRGFIIGIMASLLSIASYLLSWQLWDPVVEKMVLKRKEVQGLPVRDGEIETMQSLMPEGMVVITTVLIIAMLFTYPKFRKSELS